MGWDSPDQDFFDFDEEDIFEDEGCDALECNRCGASNLHWDDTNGERWRLCEANGNFHDCQLTEAADGFERIE